MNTRIPIFIFILFNLLLIVLLIVYVKTNENMEHITFLENRLNTDTIPPQTVPTDAGPSYHVDASPLLSYSNTPLSRREMRALEECQVPTLNTEQCYKSQEYECPIKNGSYSQCTNNYIPLPKQFNSDCTNRTFEMTPAPWKISENCYYHKMGWKR